MGEYEQYRGIYCTLCRRLGRRYGLHARMTLSYDLTFLALLQTALSPQFSGFRPGRCSFNTAKRCPRCIDTAAAVARQAARGDDAGVRRAEELAPTGARVTVGAHGGSTHVTVTLRARPLALGLRAIPQRLRRRRRAMSLPETPQMLLMLRRMPMALAKARFL